MAGRLAGRSAIVTGAGMGIGRGIAEALAQEGASVVVAEVDEAAGAETARYLTGTYGTPAVFARTDVSDRDQVQAMVQTAADEFGGVDILVNNAWRGLGFARIENTQEQAVRDGFDIGVMAAFWSMQAAFPHLRQSVAGRVVNLASLNGVNAHMYSAPYNMAKEALRTLTRTAAREWAPHGICCNVICPGARSVAFDRMAEASPENAKLMEAQNPMGRIGRPLEDIGPVALFLASDDCRYLTGNTLFVDGGSHINGVNWAPDVD